MTALHMPDPVETPAQRKQRLRQECLDYRAAISRSRRVIRNNIGVEAIAKTAVGIVGQRAQAALGQFADLFDLTSLNAAKVRRALPMLLSVYSLLSRRALVRPILRGAAVVAVAGTGLYLYSRNKSGKRARDPVPEIIRTTPPERY